MHRYRQRLTPEDACTEIERCAGSQFDPEIAALFVEEVRRHFGDVVFRTVVPRSVRLAEAPSHGLPAIVHDRRSSGADAYWKVAMELVERG